MACTQIDVTPCRPRRCRLAALALFVLLGVFTLACSREAAADDRTETLRILVRAKSAIEVGLTAQEFADLVRQLDEQIQMTRLTKSQDLAPRQLELASAAADHLKAVGLLWSYLNQATYCRDPFGFYDVIKDRSCKTRLVERLSELGLKLADVSASEDSLHPRQIIQAALEAAHKRVTSAIEAFAAR